MEFKIVTICGSMKLYDEMLKLANEYTTRGLIVLMPFAVKNGDGDMLDEMHRKKIEMSDEITVVVRDNYIGRSTRSEIEFAARIGRIIDYHELEPSPHAR